MGFPRQEYWSGLFFFRGSSLPRDRNQISCICRWVLYHWDTWAWLKLFETEVFMVAQTVKNLPAMSKTWVWSLGWEYSPEEGMATYPSILAWRIPMDRGAWWTIFHGVAKSWMWLGTHTHTHILRLSVEAKHCRNLKKIASIQSSKFNTMWHGKKKSPFSICLIQYCQTFLPWVINVFISQLQSKKLDDKDFTLFIFMSSIPGIEDIKLSQWFWLRKQTHWLPCWLSR